MSDKTEIVFLRASDREVFFDDFLVCEFSTATPVFASYQLTYYPSLIG